MDTDDAKEALGRALAAYFKAGRAWERAYRALETARAWVEENPDDGKLWATYNVARDNWLKARAAADAAADRYRAAEAALDAVKK